MSTTSFEKEVTVAAHANYGAFRGKDNTFYKPAGKDMRLEDFEVDKTYKVRGYSSESGKTHYITMILSDSVVAEAKPVEAKPVEAKPVGRRMSVAKPVEERAGDEKGLTKLGGARDFVKEAKGKTYSLIVAGLAHNSAIYSNCSLHMPLDTVILDIADRLLKAIEDRGYF